MSAAKSPGPDPLLGRVINDRFKITGLIARGGMGKVYRAEQQPLGRVCALKILNPSYAGEHDPEFHKRFFLEASIASKLTHPNTVTIFDYGRTEDDIYYMAMEFLEGTTLHRAIRDAGHFPEERAAHIGRQVCRALREAHALGVIHRDLKPANIFLVEHGDENDFVKVLDFGLVKDMKEGEDLTQTGLFMGSPKYMSPEQIRGDKVDGRADVYALGIMLYEMATGKVPFERPNSVNILMAHVNDPPPAFRAVNPEVQTSAAFEETVMACLAKNPEERFRTMDDVLSSLKMMGGGTLTQTVSGAGLGHLYEPGTVPPPPARASGARLAVAAPSPGAGTPALAPVPTPALGSAPVFASPTTGSQPNVFASQAGSYVPPPPPSLTGPAPSGPQSWQAGPQRSSTTAVAVAVTMAIVALLAIGFAAFKSNAPQPAPSAIPLVAVPRMPVSTTSEPAATSAAPPLQVVTIRLNTEPDGVSVKEDGVERCASTPCDVTYTADAADPAKAHRYVFVKPGFRAETRTVKAGDSPVLVKLTQAAARWIPPAAPAPKPDTPAVPGGYKTDVPY